MMDIIQVLTQQPDFKTARKYWNKLKERLAKEGSQLVTNCHQLKMPAADGKNYLTDAATAETGKMDEVDTMAKGKLRRVRACGTRGAGAEPTLGRVGFGLRMITQRDGVSGWEVIP